MTPNYDVATNTDSSSCVNQNVLHGKPEWKDFHTLSCPPARAWLPAAPMRTPPAHTQNRHPRWSSSGSPATTSPSFPQRATPSPSPVVSDAPGSLHTSSADRGGKRILESHWQNLKYNIFNFIFLILALFVQDLYYFYAIYIATEVSLIAPELSSQFGLLSQKSKTNIENVGKGKLVGRDVLHHHTLSVFSHSMLQSQSRSGQCHVVFNTVAIAGSSLLLLFVPDELLA